MAAILSLSLLAAQASLLPYWARAPFTELEEVADHSIDLVLLIERSPNVLSYLNSHFDDDRDQLAFESVGIDQVTLLTFPPDSGTDHACVEPRMKFEAFSNGSALVEHFMELTPRPGSDATFASNALYDAVLTFDDSAAASPTRVVVLLAEHLPAFHNSPESHKQIRTFEKLIHRIQDGCGTFASLHPRMMEQAVEAREVYVATLLLHDHSLGADDWKSFSTDRLHQPHDFVQLVDQEVPFDVALENLLRRTEAWNTPLSLSSAGSPPTTRVLDYESSSESDRGGVLIRLVRRPQVLHLEAEF